MADQITTSTGQPWLVEYTITDNDKGCDKTLSTSGTYLDRNIKLSGIKAQEGAAGATDAVLNLTAGAGSSSLTASAGMTLLDSEPSTGESYTLTAKGSGSVSGTADGGAKITKAGWLDTQTLTSTQATGSKTSNEATTTKYVAKQTVNNNQSLPDGTSAAGTIDAGKYLKINVGYNPSTVYYKAQSASDLDPSTLANAPTSGVTYTDISSSGPEIPAEGYLYINKGYTDAKKISLSRLIADTGLTPWAEGIDANVRSGYNFLTNDGVKITGSMSDSSTTTNPSTADIKALKCGEGVEITAGYLAKAKQILAASLASQTGVDSGKTAATAASMREGYQAWVDGNKVSGTMGNATVASGTPSASNMKVTYNSTAGNYSVTADLAAAAASVTTGGYIDSSTGTKNTSSAAGASVGSIAAATFTTNADKASTITADGTITAGKYIKITGGYNPSDKYYYAPAQSDGTKAVVTSGSAKVTSLTYTYDSTDANYKIAGSATIAAPSVGTAGYISSSAGTKNTNTATVETTVAASTISGALVPDSTKTAGYSTYSVKMSAGYNPTANKTSTTSEITVYQGTWS